MTSDLEPPRMFPMLRGEAPIPWAWAEWFYRCYAARQGRSQSLERLAERGGSTRGEIQIYATEVAEASKRRQHVSHVTDLPAGEPPEFLAPGLVVAVEAVWLAQLR